MSNIFSLDVVCQVWGILRANEPPRQFVEGGEFYVLNVVPYVTKVSCHY